MFLFCAGTATAPQANAGNVMQFGAAGTTQPNVPSATFSFGAPPPANQPISSFKLVFYLLIK